MLSIQPKTIEATGSHNSDYIGKVPFFKISSDIKCKDNRSIKRK